MTDDSGQAIVEYILMVMLVIGVASGLAIGLRRSVFRIWSYITTNVAAACPGCPPSRPYNVGSGN